MHTTGGYSVGTYITTKWVFDLKEDDIYWCTADIGWVTGHSYIVYGPLQNGATVLMYEGAPNLPDCGRFWRSSRSTRSTSSTPRPPRSARSSSGASNGRTSTSSNSLRLLGTVGEPINPEAWMWYREVIGGKRCPIVDTWWQTETGRDHDRRRCPGRSRPSRGRRRGRFRESVPEVVNARRDRCRRARADSW